MEGAVHDDLGRKGAFCTAGSMHAEWDRRAGRECSPITLTARAGNAGNEGSESIPTKRRNRGGRRPIEVWSSRVSWYMGQFHLGRGGAELVQANLVSTCWCSRLLLVLSARVCGKAVVLCPAADFTLTNRQVLDGRCRGVDEVDDICLQRLGASYVSRLSRASTVEKAPAHSPINRLFTNKASPLDGVGVLVWVGAASTTAISTICAN